MLEWSTKFIILFVMSTILCHHCYDKTQHIFMFLYTYILTTYPIHYSSPFELVKSFKLHTSLEGGLNQFSELKYWIKVNNCSISNLFCSLVYTLFISPENLVNILSWMRLVSCLATALPEYLQCQSPFFVKSTKFQLNTH